MIMSERFKILVIAVLIILSCVLIYYFHAVFKTETIFIHFFYIPVILSSLWWQRKGLFIAVFLAWVLILSHLLFLSTNISGDIVRAVFLVIVSYVIGSISEKEEEEKGKIAQIVYGSFMPSFVIDDRHRVVHWNKALESLAGIKEKEIIGTDGQWRAFYTEKRPCMADLIVDGVSEEEIEKNYKDKYRKSSLVDGAYEAVGFFPEIERWLRFTANSITDINGKIVGALETLEDITERKRAEQEVLKLNKELELKVEQKTKELTKERDYIRHLMETSPNFQILMNKEGKIIDANEAFEEIVEKKVKGMSIYKYLPQEKIDEIIHEVSEKGKVKNFEITTDIPGRGGFACNVSATSSFSLDGKPIIYMGGMDITERKKAQQEREKLEMQLVHTSRLSSLGEMATAIAHEINQPLTIISAATEGLLRDIEKNRLEFSLLPQDLGDIMGNVKRIDKIISHMRIFSRQPEEIKTAKPEQFLSNAFTLIEEQFRVHNISVSYEIEKNLPLVEVEPNQIEQAFVNILTNARQVLDEKGFEAEKEGISFQKKIRCSISRKGNNVVFEFADNGYGVPDEIKTKIFEPFFTTKEVGEGTGLGLSITYGIITRMKGKIWVEDNEMKGASFKIALPVKE